MEKEDQKRQKYEGDLNREKVVYAYLLILSDLPNFSLLISGNEIICNIYDSDKPNESSLAKQWDLERSTTIRRILRFVLPNLYPQEKLPSPPSLTLGKIIQILKSLEEYWKEKSGRKISRSEKMTVLRLFFQCSQDEYQSMDLPPNSAGTLFHKLFDDIYDINKGKRIDLTESKEKSLLLYKSFFTAWMHKEKEEFSPRKNLELDILSFIDNYSSVVTSLNEKEKIAKTVLREINRIKMQNGNFQLMIANVLEDSYLPLKFVKQLTTSIVENTVLSQDFPLQVESIDVEKVGPLPLNVGNNSSLNSFLNKKVMDSIENCDFCKIENEDRYFGKENLESLENQCTYNVKVNFSIEIPDNIDLKDFEGLKIIKRDVGTGTFIYFYEEARGIGSPLSHAISVVNNVLFNDIFLLRDFFPVASDIINIEQSVGNDRHSAIWSHNVVQLRLKKDIKKSVEDKVKFEDVNSFHNVSHGDYCGFDLLEVITKSSLYSRLRAIQQTGANPQQYRRELLEKIKEKNIIRKSKKILDFYPFSLKAMERNLAKYMTCNYWDSITFKKKERKWSLNAYDSVLIIISAYLQNGLFDDAKKYLGLIEQDFTHVNDIDYLILSKFMLYKARYHYLSCTNTKETHQKFDSYSETVKEFLRKSIKALQDHIEWSHKIGEIANVNLYPFSSILAQAYIFSAELRLLDQDYEKLIQSLKLFEKARILAARDGNSSLYSYISAYQSWCYLLVGMRIEDGGKIQMQKIFNVKQDSVKKDCLLWSKKVLDHSIECYESMGKQCFEDIKEKGGQAGDGYGIEPMPFIKETYGTYLLDEIDTHQEQQAENSNDREIESILELDVTQLKKYYDTHGHEKKVYLFGTYSCIFLFSIGLIKLYELAFEITSEDIEYEKLSFEMKVRSISQLLTYSFSIAEDGITDDGMTDNYNEGKTYKRSRKNEKDIYKESRIKCLYPFRITQFADFGKVFSIVCELFLLEQMKEKNSKSNESEVYKKRTQYVEYLLAELGKGEYNKHLQECFGLVKEDTNSFLGFLQKEVGDLRIQREKIISNFFAYMHRGTGMEYSSTSNKIIGS